jgi:hypothetical protein
MVEFGAVANVIGTQGFEQGGVMLSGDRIPHDRNALMGSDRT